MDNYGFCEQALAGYFNMQPSTVKGSANVNTEFHKRYLYMLVYSVFDFELPEDWALNYFRFWLFHYGSIGVIYTKEFGWIDSPYGVEKLDRQYQPRVITVSNTFLNDVKKGIIGVNAGIVRITDDFFGLDDLVTQYATKLAAIDKSIEINLMNCNVAKGFPAEDKKQADAIKEAYGKATTGEPMVVINKEIWNGRDKALYNLFGNVGADYIVDRLQVEKRQVINEFLTKIGIRNANYDKKERLNSAEVEQNNDETRAIVDVMLANIQKSFAEINRISGLNLRVTYHYEGVEEVLNND